MKKNLKMCSRGHGFDKSSDFPVCPKCWPGYYKKRTRYVALLRGINVGGNKKVEMAKLKKLFESLGFTNVSTYINSGNVIFETGIKQFEIIENALEKEFGFEIKVLIRSSENIIMLSKKIPVEWQNNPDMKTDVLFLRDEFDKKSTTDLIESNPQVDTLKYFPGAIVWSINKANYNKSGMHKFIGTKVYKNMTARNVNTVRKLAALMK